MHVKVYQRQLRYVVDAVLNAKVIARPHVKDRVVHLAEIVPVNVKVDAIPNVHLVLDHAMDSVAEVAVDHARRHASDSAMDVRDVPVLVNQHVTLVVIEAVKIHAVTIVMDHALVGVADVTPRAQMDAHQHAADAVLVADPIAEMHAHPVCNNVQLHAIITAQYSVKMHVQVAREAVKWLAAITVVQIVDPIVRTTVMDHAQVLQRYPLAG